MGARSTRSWVLSATNVGARSMRSWVLSATNVGARSMRSWVFSANNHSLSGSLRGVLSYGKEEKRVHLFEESADFPDSS
jgi:hypothetical protein